MQDLIQLDIKDHTISEALKVHATVSYTISSVPVYRRLVRFEVFTAVTMKNCVFWDVTPCGSCKSRRFGGTQRLLHQGDKNR
jgi:hypothetical protein